MAMIDRYKKKGGFVQLLNLLETTGKDKKDKFLKMIADESPAWEVELKKKMFSIEKISNWPTQTLMEILPQIPPTQIAAALAGLPPDQKERFLKAVGTSEKRKMDEYLKDSTPNPGEITTCQMKILTEIRTMVSNKKLNLEVVAPEMSIAENIEDQLLNGGGAVTAMSPTGGKMDAPVEFKNEPAPQGTSPQVAEELNVLRKKVFVLAQENQKLSVQLHQVNSKLEQIRKIA